MVESDEFYIEVVGTFVRLFLQYEFVAMRTGEEALAQVTDTRPDLMMVDLDADDRASVEFAEKMRDDPATKNIPIIAIAQDETRHDEALGAGCSSFLAKPFKIKELEALIGKLLGDD
jgi:CheY-like chemotaxis protein